VVALVVALAGMGVVLYADHRDRDDVDRTLTARVAQVRASATKSGALPTDGTYAVRLIDGTGVRAEKGSTTKFSIPVKDGYSTVTAADGSHWRSWAERLKTGAQLQILVDLKDVEEQHSGNVRMIDLIVLLAAIVAAAGTWFVGGLVLRPLLRLAEGAQAITTSDDATIRLPVVTSPPEVAELGNAINGALDRMAGQRAETATPVAKLPVEKPPPVAKPVEGPSIEELAEQLAEAAAGEFVKETSGRLRAPLAELGEGLDELLDNPEMSATQRHLYLAAIQTEYRRIVTLVDDLEARTSSR
jgi:methyl-accepting chemotaxis protein